MHRQGLKARSNLLPLRFLPVLGSAWHLWWPQVSKMMLLPSWWSRTGNRGGEKEALQRGGWELEKKIVRKGLIRHRATRTISVKGESKSCKEEAKSPRGKETIVKTVAQDNSGNREIKRTCVAETTTEFRRKLRKRNTTKGRRKQELEEETWGCSCWTTLAFRCQWAANCPHPLCLVAASSS